MVLLCLIWCFNCFVAWFDFWVIVMMVAMWLVCLIDLLWYCFRSMIVLLWMLLVCLRLASGWCLDLLICCAERF